MYYLNDNDTREIIHISACYDDMSDYILYAYPKVKIIPDKQIHNPKDGIMMPNVWWVFEGDKNIFMFTSCEPISGVELES